MIEKIYIGCGVVFLTVLTTVLMLIFYDWCFEFFTDDYPTEVVR